MPSKAPNTTADTVTIPLESAERFFATFERSAKRWERIVYPGLAIVVVMMVMGFYMIYKVTQDMYLVVERFSDPVMTTSVSELASDMQHLTESLAAMSANMEIMTARVGEMSEDTKVMAGAMDHLASMDAQMATMNTSLGTMGNNMDRIRWDMSAMNRSISRPMNMMNSMMPF